MREKLPPKAMELEQRQTRINIGEYIISLLKRSVTIERAEFDKDFPMCYICRERFEPQAGSRCPDGKFMCFPCQKDHYN